MDRHPGRRLHRLRTHLWRGRFVVAALCCGLAAMVAVDALRPPEPRVEHVVVTAREVPGGATISSLDVTTVPVVADLAPGALLTDADDAVGAAAPVTLPAGVPLHRGLLPEGGPRVPDGRVVVAVRLTESTWLRAGDRIDLLAAEQDGDRLARRALVLPPAVDQDAGTDAGGLLHESTTSSEAPPTLVAVDPDEAAAVSAASGWGALVAVLVP